MYIKSYYCADDEASTILGGKYIQYYKKNVVAADTFINSLMISQIVWLNCVQNIWKKNFNNDNTTCQDQNGEALLFVIKLYQKSSYLNISD